jgi:hypothetical protein
MEEDPGKGMAIASLVLGIISLCMPYAGIATAIVGLVLGIIARKKQQATGMPTGMAIAGIVCSAISLAFAILITIFCISVYNAASCYLNDLINEWSSYY